METGKIRMKKLLHIPLIFTGLTLAGVAGGNATPTETVEELETAISKEYVKTVTQSSEERASSVSSLYIGLGYSFMKKYNKTRQNKVAGHAVAAQIGYEINEVVALEGRYSSTVGNVRAHNQDNEWQVTNMAVFLRPQYQIDTVTLYALLGYGETKFDDQSVEIHSERGFQWGFGADFEMTKSLSMFADYINMYTGEGFDDIDMNNDIYFHNVTVGLKHTF